MHRILHNLAVDRARRRREVPAEDVAEIAERLWRPDSYTVDAARSPPGSRAGTSCGSRLEGCPNCPPLYAALVATTDALRSTGRDPDSVVPPAIASRLSH